jgi:hypothetical protein
MTERKTATMVHFHLKDKPLTNAFTDKRQFFGIARFAEFPGEEFWNDVWLSDEFLEDHGREGVEDFLREDAQKAADNRLDGERTE